MGEDHPSKVVAIILTIKATMAGERRTSITKKCLKTRHKTVKWQRAKIVKDIIGYKMAVIHSHLYLPIHMMRKNLVSPCRRE